MSASDIAAADVCEKFVKASRRESRRQVLAPSSPAEREKDLQASCVLLQAKLRKAEQELSDAKARLNAAHEPFNATKDGETSWFSDRRESRGQSWRFLYTRVLFLPARMKCAHGKDVASNSR